MRWVFIIILFISCNSENEDMKLIASNLKSETTDGSQGYFESMFLNNDNFVSQTVQFIVGEMRVYYWFTDKVIITTYETSTGDANGEFIQFGRASVRESSGVGVIGAFLIYLSTDTVIPFAFKPITSANEWIPYHGIKTTFAVSGTRALIYVDGVPYNITDIVAPIEFVEISINQHIYGLSTPGGVSIVNPDRADAVVELTSKMTIGKQQMRQEQSFKFTKGITWAIGYTPMWSADGNSMIYQLLNNGKKFIFSGVNGQQDYNKDIYEFGFNSVLGYGGAVITKQGDDINYVDGSLCDRYVITSQDGSKAKLYFEVLRADTIPIGEIFTNDTKYIWGRADGFMDIYNNAETENP